MPAAPPPDPSTVSARRARSGRGPRRHPTCPRRGRRGGRPRRAARSPKHLGRGGVALGVRLDERRLPVRPVVLAVQSLGPVRGLRCSASASASVGQPSSRVSTCSVRRRGARVGRGRWPSSVGPFHIAWRESSIAASARSTTSRSDHVAIWAGVSANARWVRWRRCAEGGVVLGPAGELAVAGFPANSFGAESRSPPAPRALRVPLVGARPVSARNREINPSTRG